MRCARVDSVRLDRAAYLLVDRASRQLAGLLLVAALAGACSTQAHDATPSRSPDHSLSQDLRLQSVALAYDLAAPRDATLLNPCSTGQSVMCWTVHKPFAQVQDEMTANLRTLRVGEVAVTQLGRLAGEPPDNGAIYLDIADATRHVRVTITSGVAGTPGHSTSTGVQTVIVQADPQ